MKKNTLLVTFIMIMFAFVLGGCAGKSNKTVDNDSNTQAVENQIILYADFSDGSPDAESLDLVKSKKQIVSDKVTVEVLAEKLSEWSGLDFMVNSAEIYNDSITVDWSSKSTLIKGLDNREQKKDFHFYDNESLNWFMMDSLARTIKGNLKVSTVYYSMDGGKSLVLKDMSILKELPVDQPYEGSAFFYAHADDRGDESATGIDVVKDMSEDKAMDLLSTVLTDRMKEGTAIVANGESEINGQHCWIFSFGKNTEEKFTAEEHYAVTDNGKIYTMDIINNKYELFAGV